MASGSPAVGGLFPRARWWAGGTGRLWGGCGSVRRAGRGALGWAWGGGGNFRLRGRRTPSLGAFTDVGEEAGSPCPPPCCVSDLESHEMHPVPFPGMKLPPAALPCVLGGLFSSGCGPATSACPAEGTARNGDTAGFKLPQCTCRREVSQPYTHSEPGKLVKGSKDSRKFSDT